jgi:hypothetical protein
MTSKGGTVRAGENQKSVDVKALSVAVDTDRLYATLDELTFARPAKNEDILASRRPQIITPGDKSREFLEMAKFFLTTSSRAPEQNLFNKPRVAIWPVNAMENRRTTFDKLIAFCSTVGPRDSAAGSKRPFIFTRA